MSQGCPRQDLPPGRDGRGGALRPRGRGQLPDIGQAKHGAVVGERTVEKTEAVCKESAFFGGGGAVVCDTD